MSIDVRSARRWLIPLGWVNVLLHIAGLAAALFLLRPGTAALALPARLTYLSTHAFGWGAGWMVWIVCALGLTVFVSLLAALHRQNFLVGMALIVTLVGVSIDVTCDLIYIVVFPLAAEQALKFDVAAGQFLVLDRAVGLASLATANGLYSIAILLLTAGLPMTWATRLAGYGTGVFGLLMALAGIVAVQGLVELSAGPTILLFCVWSVLLARTTAVDGP